MPRKSVSRSCNSPTTKPKVKRRKKTPWTKEETECLRAGILRYGAGNWGIIHRASSGILVCQTVVDLKDKWQNMKGPDDD
ncbi:unnamed protein product [Calypogeia fissa]